LAKGLGKSKGRLLLKRLHEIALEYLHSLSQDELQVFLDEIINDLASASVEDLQLMSDIHNSLIFISGNAEHGETE